MELTLTRFLSDNETTLGVLRLDGVVVCFTLEDERRAVKVAGETRIPAGRYQILTRGLGGMVLRYREKYPWHRGMLWLQDVPGFKWIYIHIGNTEEDTAGCILAAFGANLAGMTLQQSADGYRSLYEEVIDAAEDGSLWITIEDRD